ncbi:hypothetical protein FF011L_38730 [Roseimaritima multifibrata]|uniref:Uncharacterized protein n=1 Tax=Roseimaritima multifibrata TaxID=1930274 RepID=A0A517MJM5_9BACT|nr:hypothetical protein [Roseimaritima multifibrata]QDS95089.1 hypothetical protein FF011L_38730 [Roseimaritima multifibrata]
MKSLRVSPTGAIVGAVICAIGRSLVVVWALGEPAWIFMFPSAGIGLLVGAISGSIGRPLLSAIIGALLSAIVFEFFLVPCVSLVGVFGNSTGNNDAASDFMFSTLKYLIGMAVAGGIGGGVGGAVGRLSEEIPIESGENTVTGEPRDEPKSW